MMIYERWINEDVRFKPYLRQLREIYSGHVMFMRVGRLKYQAQLDTSLLSYPCCATHATLELDMTKRSNEYRNAFFLHTTTDRNTDTIKLFK